MSRLERNPLFIMAGSLLATFATRHLLAATGMPPLREFQLAQWAVYFFCFYGVWRAFCFMSWLAALCFAPSLVIQPQRADR